MVWDPRSVGGRSLVVIHTSPIEQVGSYRHLGVHSDDAFSQNVHVDSVCSRLQQRLFVQTDSVHHAFILPG